MDVRVTHVRVVVHLSQDLGGVSENHWSIYLLLEGGETSVRMNMAVNYGDPTGTLEITEHTYQLTQSSLRYWDFPAGSGVLASWILFTMRNLGRDRYMFSGGGSGCRYWCYTVIQDLEQVGYVAQGSFESLWPHLRYVYSQSSGPRPINWVVGEFY